MNAPTESHVYQPSAEFVSKATIAGMLSGGSSTNVRIFRGSGVTIELDAVDLDAPRIRRFIQNRAHLSVDQVSGGQRLVQLQPARMCATLQHATAGLVVEPERVAR